MPDDILSILIAHELAHPVTRISWRHHSPEMFQQGSANFALLLKPEYEAPEEQRGTWMDDEETETRELQDFWGFEEEMLCNWEEEHTPRLKQKYDEEMAALMEDIDPEAI